MATVPIPTNEQLRRGFQTPVSPTPAPTPAKEIGLDPQADRYTDTLRAKTIARPEPVVASTAAPIANPAGVRHSGQRDTSSPTVSKAAQDELAASKMNDASTISMLPVGQEADAQDPTFNTRNTASTSTTKKTVTPAATAPGASSGAGGSTAAPTPTADQKKYDLEVDNAKSEKMMDDLMTSQKNLTNPYMDKLNSMEFEYTAESDPDYQQAAAQMETRLMTSMTGRGALYSSVAQAAYQAKLIELESSYRQGAYQEFVNDRAFTQSMAQMVYTQQNNDFTKGMQLVQFQTGREDTAWTQKIQVANFEAQRAAEAFNQKMQVAQYNAQRQDAAWQKSMQQQQLNISRANAAASRKAAEAQEKLSGVRATIETNVAKVQVEQTKFNKAVSAWQSGSRGADKTVVDYFASKGIKIAEGTSYSSKVGQTARTRVDTSIQNSIAYVQQQATEYKQADILQASAFGFTMGNKDTTASDNFFANQKAALNYDVTNYSSAVAKLNDLKNNAGTYKSQMTATQYAELVSDARKMVDDYDKKSFDETGSYNSSK